VHAPIFYLQPETIPATTAIRTYLWDAAYAVEGVAFENFTVNGAKVTNADDLDIFTRHANGISFA